MPFTDIARVPGFEDFGFAFQEGAPNVAFDDQHDIASFVYVEPMSHWLAMPRDVPRTYDGALSVLNKDLAGARGKEAAEMAAATLTSGIENADGRFFLHLEKAPWCDGGVFTLNPDPDIRHHARPCLQQSDGHAPVHRGRLQEERAQASASGLSTINS